MLFGHLFTAVRFAERSIMQVRVVPGSLDSLALAALVVPVFADKRLDGAAAAADALLDGAVADLLSDGEIAGRPNERALVHAAGKNVKRVLIVGLGEREKFEPSALASYAGAAVRYLGKRNIHSIAFALPLEAQHHVRAAASFIVEGAIAGTLDATIYRTEPDHPIDLQ
ncbi:MAG: M17 family peptidase N-terminal domain-containing protein, partial [Vulcanimicrobiaceae bacterium]